MYDHQRGGAAESVWGKAFAVSVVVSVAAWALGAASVAHAAASGGLAAGLVLVLLLARGALRQFQ